MSIIDTFDSHGEEIIKAKNNIRMIENFPTTMIVVFSAGIRELFLNKYNASKIGSLNAGGQKLPIYQFEYKGIKIGFFNTVLGGAGAAALLEELIALGAKKYYILVLVVLWIGKLQEDICWFPQRHTEMKV